jgi:hypothetical protein
VRLIEAPQWCARVLRRFGLNPYGQPIFRCIWGPSATKIVGGYWMDSGTSEYRVTKRYGDDPKWILERWQPASEIGTPQSWDASTLTYDGFYGIGPFPAHGRYLHCTTFSVAKGPQGYVPLEAGLVEMTARAVWMGRTLSKADIAIAERDESLAAERAQDANFDALWDEKQLSRQGLSIGAGGAFNKAEEVADMERRIERAGVFIDGRKFKTGLKQQ